MKEIVIHEVGLRDGLQMEKLVVPLAQKIRWAEALIASGVDVIQLGSFVHPDKVPQMADTDALFEYFKTRQQRSSNVVLSGLVLNEKGLERGERCGVDMYCMGVSASDTHSRKNTGMSTEEATGRIIAMGKQALLQHKKVQVSVQSAFGCGFEGTIPARRVLTIVRSYLEAGLKNISLADTAGHGQPFQVHELFEQVLALDPSVECSCHFHNTYGMGMANTYAAMTLGIRYFESSFAGLGGCPFTKVAAGNVCTEDFVHFLQRAGMRMDVSIDSLLSLSKEVAVFFGREMPGHVYKSGPILSNIRSN
ncbi:MAG: hydroxymethylglutaryl-CoA lyase [Ignavibacteriales bacterium]|nr:hydroxymethylglutaryl-CoA lyase [Ignavibacteriales bacterium]